MNAVLLALACYALAFTVLQLALYALAGAATLRYMAARERHGGPPPMTGDEPPLTVLVPAFNEEATVVSSVRSVLQLLYPRIEVIVVNDGSRDGTLAALTAAFDLAPAPPVYRKALATAAVRAVYRSRREPRLRVIDKDNGGKADSLNAALNLAATPLVCCVDADSILERDALLRVVRPFLDSDRVVASGGTVRIANGCRVEHGHVVEVGLARRWLPLMQTIEYLRAITVTRMGWDRIGALLIISGAFGVFRREAVLEAGGYRTDTVGEDMELIMRLHRRHRAAGLPYAIRFVPDPVCWTEAPEDLATLRSQRTRWHRGLFESLVGNLGLLAPRGGAVGWVALPYALLFEWASPLVEAFGYAYTSWGLATGRLDALVAAEFAVGAALLALLLNGAALLVDAIGFRTARGLRDVALLFGAGIVELFGYRQFNLVWRLRAIGQSLTGRGGGWGKMRRSGRWQAGG